MLRKRSLALTSPSPAPGERRACTPVAQLRAQGLTAGAPHWRPRARILAEAPNAQEATAAAGVEPSIDISIGIFIILFGKGDMQVTSRESGVTNIRLLWNFGPSSLSALAWQRKLRAATLRPKRMRRTSALTSGGPPRPLRACNPRGWSTVAGAEAVDLGAAAADTELLFYAVPTGSEKLVIKMRMMPMTIMLKVNFQEGASAARLVDTVNVTGLFTPIQASPVDGMRLPFWLVVWPIEAAARRNQTVVRTGTRRCLGAVGSTGRLCTIVVMKPLNVEMKHIARNVPLGRRRLAIGATGPPAKADLQQR